MHDEAALLFLAAVTGTLVAHCLALLRGCTSKLHSPATYMCAVQAHLYLHTVRIKAQFAVHMDLLQMQQNLCLDICLKEVAKYVDESNIGCA